MTKQKRSDRPAKWREVGAFLKEKREDAKLSQDGASRYLMALAKYPTEIAKRTISEYESGRTLAEADRLICLLNLYATSKLPALTTLHDDETVCEDPVLADSDHKDHQRVVALLLELAAILVSHAGDLARSARKQRIAEIEQAHYRSQGRISYEDAKFQQRPWTKGPLRPPGRG